jgi:hypothetical protein
MEIGGIMEAGASPVNWYFHPYPNNSQSSKVEWNMTLKGNELVARVRSVTPPLRLGGLVGSIQIVDKGEELWGREYFVLSSL